MFEMDDWYENLHRNIYNRPRCVIKKFKIGDVYIRVWNYGNQKLEIDNINFNMSVDGELSVFSTDKVSLKSLDELKDKVNLYRKTYKLLKDTQKQIKMQGDF